MCELAKGGMFKVEHAETSIDQKLNHVWNFPIIKVTYRVSIFQLKAREDTQSQNIKVIFKLKKKTKLDNARRVQPVKLNSKIRNLPLIGLAWKRKN